MNDGNDLTLLSLAKMAKKSGVTSACLREQAENGNVPEKLTGSIPIACEFALSDRWYKSAEAVLTVQGNSKNGIQNDQK